MVTCRASGQGEVRENSRRFIFFVNPRTRHGRAGKQLEALQVRSVGPSLRGETAVVRSHEDMRRYLDSAPPDMIGVACGGDGTVQALARALVEAGDLDRTIGTLPFGYGNAFACSLGIRSIDEAVRVLHEGEIRRLDIMTTDHPRTPVVLVSLSVGFESLFIEKYASLRVLPRPAGALLGLLAAAGRSYRGIRLELQGEIVLEPEESVYNAGLYNMPSYAFDWRLPPKKDPEDGWAEAVTARTALDYWRLFLSALPRGKREVPKPITSRSWQEAYIESGWPLQADGETIPASAFSVRLRPRYLAVLGPQRSGPRA